MCVFLCLRISSSLGMATSHTTGLAVTWALFGIARYVRMQLSAACLSLIFICLYSSVYTVGENDTEIVIMEIMHELGWCFESKRTTLSKMVVESGRVFFLHTSSPHSCLLFSRLSLAFYNSHHGTESSANIIVHSDFCLILSFNLSIAVAHIWERNRW